jgi:hypothetical protein
VLDLDTDHGFESIDAFLEAIGLAGVSYVLHHSSSPGSLPSPGCGRTCSSSWRPQWRLHRLKLWLRHLNLTVPGLREQVSCRPTE